MSTLKTVVRRVIGLSALAACFVTLLSRDASADNPIVQTNYTADPAPMVYGDRLYLYTSHDEDVTVNGFFTMNDWRLYSTVDMVNWTDHGSPAGYKTFSWGTGDAWAPQGVARNGKFYLYVPMNNATGAKIGVAVATDPAGPFTDALGKALVSTGTGDIDPTVFIDDDGQAYLYWGNPNLWYVKLNSDMISYPGSPTQINLTTAGFGVRSNTDRTTAYEEGPWFYKRGSLYYLVYAADGTPEKISYTTSSAPLGPWTYGGDVMAKETGTGATFTNHPGVIDYKGKSYFFYHDGALPGGGDYKRSVCVEEFTYNSDGSIPTIKKSTDGPAAVATLDPFQQVEAETIAFSAGLKTETCTDTGGGIDVTSISNGDYIKVKNVDFSDGVTAFSARVSGASNNAKIELHLEAQSGALLGTCDVSNASSWTTKTCPVTGGSGNHDLFLVFVGGSGDLFKFNWWQFTGSATSGSSGGAGGQGGMSGASGASGAAAGAGGASGSGAVTGSTGGSPTGNGGNGGVGGKSGTAGQLGATAGGTAGSSGTLLSAGGASTAGGAGSSSLASDGGAGAGTNDHAGAGNAPVTTPSTGNGGSSGSSGCGCRVGSRTTHSLPMGSALLLGLLLRRRSARKSLRKYALLAPLCLLVGCGSNQASNGGPTTNGGAAQGAQGGSAPSMAGTGGSNAGTANNGVGGASGHDGGSAGAATAGGSAGGAGGAGGVGTGAAAGAAGMHVSAGGAGGSAQAGTGGSAAGASGAGAGHAGSGGSGGAAVTDGNLYVAPNGDDANPGTLAAPLKTVAHARDVVRTLNTDMKSDITVYLRAGTYQQASTLTFANADSGTNGFYVKYVAYPGEQPIITGGKPITGWTLSDSTNGVYSASGVTTSFRQLYVNGVKAIRARSPNLGSDGSFNFNRLTGADNTAQNIQVAASEVGTWNDLKRVEMHVITGWGDNTLRIDSMSTSGGTAFIKVQSPESTIVFVRPYPHLGGQFDGFTKHVYYFENAREFLDQAGEWYLDETASVLYYKPRSGEDVTQATVVAPVLETIMSVAGTSTTSQAGYLWFQGITFEHSTYMRPSQSGFCDAQAGQYNLTATSDNKQTIGRPPAGVSVTNANHLHFERNVFTQMGASGLDFVSGTHDDLIVGNVVTDVAGNGISIGKFTQDDNTEYHVPYDPTDKNEICTSDTIKDNYIHHVTTEFQGGCGIAAGYPKQLDIERNEVAYTNYTAISVGYGWTASVNAMSTNKINANDVHDVVQILADGAAIYTLSNQSPNSELEYNYIHDFQTSKWADYGSNGIYLDEQTTGYTVAHNALVSAPTNVAQNHTGTNTITDTPAGNPQSVKSMAGIETSYADIKTLSIPKPSF